MPVRGKAKKKECKHEWEWLDCHEGLVCKNEGCTAYTQDLDKAPFGESTLLYKQREFYIGKLMSTNIKLSQLQVLNGAGWAFFIFSVVVGYLSFSARVCP